MREEGPGAEDVHVRQQVGAMAELDLSQKFSNFFYRRYHGKMANDDEELQFWLSAMANNDD